MEMNKLNRNPGCQSVESTHSKLLEIILQEHLSGTVLNLGSRDWVPPIRNSTIYNCDLHDWHIPNLVRCDLDCGQSFPYKDEAFDFVLASSIIEHLECHWHLFREVHRVLKPNGVFVVDFPNIVSPVDRELFAKEGRFRWYSMEHTAGGHINLIPNWEAYYIAYEAGFQIAHVDYTDLSEEIIIITLKKT